MNKTFSFACAAVAAPFIFSQSAAAEFDYFTPDASFKRFSVSAGWLHAIPTGDPTPVQNKTSVPNGFDATNGSVTVGTVKEVIDPNQDQATIDKVNGTLGLLDDNQDLGALGASGNTIINGLESFATPGTGLESDDVDTIGLLFNYNINENWSIETKAGIPPEVDILGNGTVFAPFEGTVTPTGIAKPLGDFDIKKDIQITDLTQGDAASTARAWLPALEVHYQFGKPGVDKFRPYIGAGMMYAYFSDIELNESIARDLGIAAGRLQLIEDGYAGGALGTKKEVFDNPNAKVKDMVVETKADSTFAPIVTLGATYDFNEDWFAVGSVSYAKLDTDTTITVTNADDRELIKAVSNIEIDPYITYLGVGYRF